MVLQTGERGQALQVGAVLLFGLLIVLFTVWQAFVIPDQNERVEFSHNQDIQSDMVELRGDLISMSDSTSPTSSSLELGTQFPTRLLFVNPTPAVGTLQTKTVGNGVFELDNAQAVQDDISQFWNGTNRTYRSESVEYVPDYRVFQGAPRTVYDNTVTYNVFDLEDGNTSTLSAQALIDGDTITLLAIDGSFAETAIGSVTPDIQPVSTQSRSVAIESPGPDPLTINVSTELERSSWESLLEGESNVVGVTEFGNETVQIQLDPDTEYELRLAKIGFGPGASDPNPAYLTEIDEQDRISIGQNYTVTVEARDRFNVPKSGVNVTAEIVTGDGTITPENEVTSPSGQVDFTLDPNEVALDPGDRVGVEFEMAPNQTLNPDAVDSFTANYTIESPTGAGRLNLEWEQKNSTTTPNCDNASDAAYCTIPTSGIGSTYRLHLHANDTAPAQVSGIEARFVNTNTSAVQITGPADPPKRQFGNSPDGTDPDDKITVLFRPKKAGSTTFVATAGGDTQVVEIEVGP